MEVAELINKAMGTNYKIIYDDWYHRITIIEPIRVVDFVLLKKIIPHLKERIYEIRVES